MTTEPRPSPADRHRCDDEDDEEINVVDVSDDEQPTTSRSIDQDRSNASVSVIRHVHIDPTHQPVISGGFDRRQPTDLDGLLRLHRASLPPNWPPKHNSNDSGVEGPLDLRVRGDRKTPLRRNKSFNSAGAKRTATTDVFTDQSPAALNKSCDADTLRRLGIKRASVGSSHSAADSLATRMEKTPNLGGFSVAPQLPSPLQQDLLMQRFLNGSPSNLELLRLYRTIQTCSPVPKSLQSAVPMDIPTASDADLGVDEHFKKSLSQRRRESANADVDAHFEKALGDTWRKLKELKSD